MIQMAISLLIVNDDIDLALRCTVMSALTSRAHEVGQVPTSLASYVLRILTEVLMVMIRDARPWGGEKVCPAP